MKIDEGYLNSFQAAKKLGLSRQRVAQMIKNKLLKSEKIGKHNLIKVTDLEEFANTPRKHGRPRKVQNNDELV